MAETNIKILQSSATEVLNLKTIMRDMPTDIRLFSLAMRSLYAQNAVGSNSTTAQKFRKLRDNSRNDAVVYLKGVLPPSTKFVASISEYFEYHESLDFEEWCEMLSDILQETIAFRQMAEALIKMHENILIPLKKRQNEADVVLLEFRHLQHDFKERKKKLEERAATKRAWAIALAFIPVINLIATPLLASSAASDTVLRSSC